MAIWNVFFGHVFIWNTGQQTRYVCCCFYFIIITVAIKLKYFLYRGINTCYHTCVYTSPFFTHTHTSLGSYSCQGVSETHWGQRNPNLNPTPLRASPWTLSRTTEIMFFASLGSGLSPSGDYCLRHAQCLYWKRSLKGKKNMHIHSHTFLRHVKVNQHEATWNVKIYEVFSLAFYYYSVGTSRRALWMWLCIYFFQKRHSAPVGDWPLVTFLNLFTGLWDRLQ